MKVEDIEPGQHLRVTVDGIVIETAYQEIHFEGHSLVIIGDKDNTIIEKIKPPLPTLIGTVLNKIGSHHPYLLKIAENEWVTIHGVRLNNREVQSDWNDELYELFNQEEVQ